MGRRVWTGRAGLPWAMPAIWWWWWWWVGGWVGGGVGLQCNGHGCLAVPHAAGGGCKAPLCAERVGGMQQDGNADVRAESGFVGCKGWICLLVCARGAAGALKSSACAPAAPCPLRLRMALAGDPEKGGSHPAAARPAGVPATRRGQQHTSRCVAGRGLELWDGVGWGKLTAASMWG